MDIGKPVLAISAAIAFVAGGLAQGRKSISLPHQIFSQAKASDFIGDARCAECHEATVAKFPGSPHAIFMHDKSLPLDRQGCEGCHGPAREHADSDNPGGHILSFSKLSAREVIDACLRCHGDLMKGPHFEIQAHARAGLSCLDCHQVHPKEWSANPLAGGRNDVKSGIFIATKDSNPMLKTDEPSLCGECHKPELADFRKISHHPIPEGRMLCSDCHSIHPTNADPMKRSRFKDNCVTCHQDLKGPFGFEHDPVAGWTGGGCAECHNPHGSHNPKLLNSVSRGLCTQCHTDKAGASHFPGQTCWTSGCHVAVHGSNHDPRLLSR